MQLIMPLATFDDIQPEISFDDGGPDFDWSKTSYQYPEDLGKSWLQTLKDEADLSQNEHLAIPDVDLSSMNDDQSFAFHIVIQTLINFISNDRLEGTFQP